MTRCSFGDHNELQCRATTEQPTVDGWPYLESWGPGIPDGYYCPAHADAIERLEGADEQD
jgi:hypothetical protein